MGGKFGAQPVLGVPKIPEATRSEAKTVRAPTTQVQPGTQDQK